MNSDDSCSCSNSTVYFNLDYLNKVLKNTKDWKNQRPLEVALYIIQVACQAGYSGLKAYALSTESMIEDDNGTIEEQLESMSTICFKVHDYFCFWLGINKLFPSTNDPTLTLSNTLFDNEFPLTNIKVFGGIYEDYMSSFTREELNNLKQNYPVNDLRYQELMSLGNGLYRCNMNGDEGHQFLWIIMDEKLYYVGGYGGVRNPVFLEFNKKCYFELYEKAMNQNDLESYKIVYGLQKIYISGVGFGSLITVKDKTYVDIK